MLAVAMALTLVIPAIAAPTPVPGNPGPKLDWNPAYAARALTITAYDYDRGNASGDKIPSNAHSADYPGLYFYWNDKQRDDGVLLVDPFVFTLFEGGTFTVTAKTSNCYWGHALSATDIDAYDEASGLYIYNVFRNCMYKDKKGNLLKDDMKNINMIFIDGKYKSAFFDIEKEWLDPDGKPLAGDDSLVSFTQGWKLGRNEVKFSDYKTAYNGKKVSATEKDIAGFTCVSANPQNLTVKCGDDPIQVMTFVNMEIKGVADASLSFEKKVEGKNIVEWLSEKYNLDMEDADDIIIVLDILAGLEFYFDGENGSYGPEVPDLAGFVVFPDIKPGAYILSEEITGAAVGIFKKMADIEINIDEGVNHFFVLGATVKGFIDENDIREGDLFTIINGYGRNGYNSTTNGLGYGANNEKLNNNGDLFYIGVKNARAPFAQFDSFCAYAGAHWFAGDGSGLGVGYMVAVSMEDEAYLRAFNYIYDNYYGGEFGTFADSGNADQSFARKVAQTVVWALLGQIDVDSDLFAQTNLTEDQQAAVAAALAAANDYIGSGSVVDVVYMLGVDSEGNMYGEEDYINCQPQIVPIFGAFFVENELEGGTDRGSVSFNKVKYVGNYNDKEQFLPINKLEEFWFNLFQIVNGEEIYVEAYYTDENGVVTTDELEPGSYVFREIPALVFDGGLGFDEDGNPAEIYNLVWKPVYPNGADGLYFTIEANGDAIWRDTQDETPTVMNVLLCKHNVLWAPDGYDPYSSLFIPFEVIDLGEGNGMLIAFTHYCKGTLEVVGTAAATCDRAGIVWLACTKGCGIGTGITIGEPLVCPGIQPVGLGAEYGMVWYACPNAGCSLPAELLFNEEAWLALGGWELPVEEPVCGVDFEHTFIAVERGAEEPWVWFGCACGASGFAEDQDAWDALAPEVISVEVCGVDYEHNFVATARGGYEYLVWGYCSECGSSLTADDKESWDALAPVEPEESGNSGDDGDGE